MRTRRWISSSYMGEGAWYDEEICRAKDANSRSSSMVPTTVRAVRPCLKALRCDRVLPVSVLGPVLRKAFLLLAAICRSLDIGFSFLFNSVARLCRVGLIPKVVGYR